MKRILIDALMVLLVASPALAQRKRKPPIVPQVSKLPPVALMHNPVPEYLSGEVSVAVRANENPLIRLGLAQNGVALIEFPANDRFFALNPGNPELVTIEDSPTKATDHFFVIRPGTGFLPALSGTASPATSIIVQMTSGMVVTLLIYPQREIERNAHRCVITYDRETVINARKAAGLAVNLDQREAEKPARQMPASIRIAEGSGESAPPITESVTASVKAKGKTDLPLQPYGHTPVSDESSNALSFRAFSPQAKWSKAAHGLKLIAEVEIANAQQHLATLAVSNTFKHAVQLVPGHPELYVQTLDGKGHVLQAEPLNYRVLATTHPDGLLAPGETARWRLAYDTPILGARQRLSLAVAQTQAADEPATFQLTAAVR